MRFRLSSGHTVGYRTRGAGQSVLLLHPVGLDATFWADVVALLSQHCRTIAVDLPGHGESDVPSPEPTLRQLGLDLVELIEAVGQPPVVLVGCSLGGMVAQAVALERPGLVKGLVLANTSHDRDAASRAALEKRADRALAGMPAVVGETIERWFEPAYIAAEPGRVARLRARLEAADPVVHAWMWRAIAGLDHGERLGAVHQPALVVSGTMDRSVPPSATRALAEVLPASRHVPIEGAGHLAPYEQPGRFAALVADFLTGL